MSPNSVAQPAPKIDVPMIIPGFTDPAAARTAMAVAGMRMSPAVLIVRNVHIAFVAVPAFGFSLFSSSIALRPNGVAALLSPSNAATPFGLKAMEELNKLNPKAGTATNAMCTFLTINTAGLILIPATAIAVRAAAGSVNPGIIIGTSIFGAGCATLFGLIAVKLFQRLPMFRRDDPGLASAQKEVSRV